MFTSQKYGVCVCQKVKIIDKTPGINSSRGVRIPSAQENILTPSRRKDAEVRKFRIFPIDAASKSPNIDLLKIVAYPRQIQLYREYEQFVDAESIQYQK